MPQIKAARLEFAKEHENWIKEQWMDVVWTDETSVVKGRLDDRKVLRRRGENNLPAAIESTYGSQKVSVMCWGLSKGRDKAPLAHSDGGMINSRKYLEIIEKNALEWLEQFETSAWMQDNATVHKSAEATKGLKEMGVEPIEWPAQSPDLNPSKTSGPSSSGTLQIGIQRSGD